MATYTFAPQDAPVSAHISGLVDALTVWHRDLKRQAENGATRQIRERAKAQADAYQQIIGVIIDSNSYTAS